jgi:hypothetical protein
MLKYWTRFPGADIGLQELQSDSADRTTRTAFLHVLPLILPNGYSSWDSRGSIATGNLAGATFTLFKLSPGRGQKFANGMDGTRDYEVFCRNYGLQGIGCFENHNGWSDLTQFDPPGLRMPSSFACNFDSGKSFYNQVGWGETITYAAQVGGDNSVWGLKDDGTRASPTQNQELWPVCALAH